MKFLGIDFGLCFFGLAYSEGELAEPLGQFKSSNLSEALKRIKKICQDKNIDHIVIGLPEGKLQPTVIGFSHKLKKQTRLPIVFQAEDFTSQEAVEKMITSQKPLKKRQNQEHSFAACLILQEYLDTMILPAKNC
ncbi:MAG TPA: Holliday junction resolvase RuvX [Candidatus Bathyarchaeia archaeon]|nr:Holliday junction resolvase RuvX [Candidatus Bathyarchaeia archaeon]